MEGSLVELHGVGYMHSFEGVRAFDWHLPDLLPSLAHLRARWCSSSSTTPPRPSRTLSRASATLRPCVNFDPAYFLENAEALNALNILLAGLKVFATYGREAFAALDAIGVGSGPQMAEELCSCTSASRRRRGSCSGPSLPRCWPRWAWRWRSLRGGKSSNWEGKELTDEDMRVFAEHLISLGSERLKSATLSGLSSNNIGDEGSSSSWLCFLPGALAHRSINLQQQHRR